MSSPAEVEELQDSWDAKVEADQAKKVQVRWVPHGSNFKPFFDGFPPIHDWLATARPDVAVVIYNDHGLNFFLDKMPTFAVGAAPEYRNADEGWGIPVVPPVYCKNAISSKDCETALKLN